MIDRSSAGTTAVTADQEPPIALNESTATSEAPKSSRTACTASV
jgi:hypothetical protein